MTQLTEEEMLENARKRIRSIQPQRTAEAMLSDDQLNMYKSGKNQDSNKWKEIPRKARAAVHGVTDIIDLAGMVGTGIGKGVGIKEFEIPSLTEWVDQQFGDVGEDDLADKGIEVLASLFGAGKARKAISWGTKAFKEGAPILKVIAQKIGEKSPAMLDQFMTKAGDLLSKPANFVYDALLPKTFSPRDVVAGVGAIKGAEATAKAIKDVDFNQYKPDFLPEDWDVNPVVKGATTLGASLGAGTATNVGSQLGMNALSQAYLKKLVDPKKVQLAKDIGAPLELARVVDDNTPGSEFIRKQAQWAADSPLASKTHKGRGETIKKAKEALSIPEDYSYDLERSSQAYRSAYKKSEKDLADTLRPYKEEAGIEWIDNPDFLNKSGVTPKPVGEEFIPYSKLPAKERLARYMDVMERGEKYLPAHIKKNTSTSLSPDEVDSMYSRLLKDRASFNPKHLSEGEMDSIYHEALSQHPTDDIHPSWTDKAKFVEKVGYVPATPSKVMKNGNKRFLPRETIGILRSFDPSDLPQSGKTLNQIINAAEDNTINVKSLYTEIEKLNQLKLSNTLTATQETAIHSLRQAATEDLTNALHAIDPQAGKAYEAFRKKYSEHLEKHPREVVEYKLENKKLHHGADYEAGAIDGEILSRKKAAPALRRIIPFMDKAESREALGHLWGVLGASNEGIDLMKIRRGWSTLEKNKQNAIRELVKKGYGKDIKVEDVFSVLGEIPKVTKHKNFSNTQNQKYLEELNKDALNLVKDIGKDKNFKKKVYDFVLHRALLPVAYNKINNSPNFIEYLVKMRTAKTPLEGLQSLQKISKTGLINAPVMNTLIDSYKKLMFNQHKE